MKIPAAFSSCLKLACIVFMFGLLRGHAQAQCASVNSEYKTASGGAHKCGITNFCDPGPFEKYYLQYKQTLTGYGIETSYSVTDVGGLFAYGWGDGSYTMTYTITYNGLDCSFQTSYSGSAKLDGTYISNEDGPDSTSSESATLDDDGEWDSNAGGDVSIFINNVAGYGVQLGGSTTTLDQCAPIMTTSQESGSGSYQSDTDGLSYSYSWSMKTSDTSTLANEFTDAMLRDYAIQAISSYPTTWSTNYTGSFGSALYTLDNHYSAGAGRMQYRFHVTDCQPHASYLVTWDQVTTYPNNSPAPAPQHMREEVKGNGDPVNGVWSSVHTVDVPPEPSWINVNNVHVVELPGSTGGS